MVKIFVEGDDDKKFIVSLLNELQKTGAIASEYIDFHSFIIGMKGKANLLDPSHAMYQQASRQILNGAIKKALFIFDCDFEENDNKCGGIKKSSECFEILIGALNWTIPTDVYIFDRNLDYFLVETIKDKECYEHFDHLVTCLDVESVKPNKKPIANLYRDLYPYPKFDFSHANFAPLKEKLINLFG